MAGFGAETRRYLKRLHKAGANVINIVAEAAQVATGEAVKTAQKHTPPNGGAPIKGTNTRTGKMSQSWATDSVTTPIISGNTVTTILANNMQYASYVNDGHRVDKHFVPGLIINGGLLEMSKDGDDGGIMVGTKTTYVPGLYMTEKATGKYKITVRNMLKDAVRRAMSE